MLQNIIGVSILFLVGKVIYILHDSQKHIKSILSNIDEIVKTIQKDLVTDMPQIEAILYNIDKATHVLKDRLEDDELFNEFQGLLSDVRQIVSDLKEPIKIDSERTFILIDEVTAILKNIHQSLDTIELVHIRKKLSDTTKALLCIKKPDVIM